MNPCRRRRVSGFTLIELVVSLATASILLLGLSSALFIALRGSDPTISPAPATLAGLNQLTQMHIDLQHAIAITEQTTKAITVAVPDRDMDANPETIRYAWSGSAGASLTRQIGGGTEAEVVADVYDFDIQYFQPESSVEYLTVRLQVSSNVEAIVQTAIPMMNRP